MPKLAVMGKVAEIKTKPTASSVGSFIEAVPEEQKRKDSLILVKLMEKLTGEKPQMWGSSLIGFGNKRYKSPSGREVDWFRIGFSPRKAALSIYLTLNATAREKHLEKLGKYKSDGGCIYIKRLEDVDIKVLEKMLREALNEKD